MQVRKSQFRKHFQFLDETASDVHTYEGILFRKRVKNRRDRIAIESGWKRFYCVLKDGFLYFYNDKVSKVMFFNRSWSSIFSFSFQNLSSTAFFVSNIIPSLYRRIEVPNSFYSRQVHIGASIESSCAC